MLDIRRIREAPQEVGELLKRKNVTQNLDQILELDQRRRELIQESDNLKSTRNTVSKEISQLQKSGEDPSEKIKSMKTVSTRIKEIDADLKNVDGEQQAILLTLPNLPHPDVPIGATENDNVVIGEWGDKPEYAFKTKDHLELGDILGILDFPRGAKISGSGFPLYLGMGARLERALINFMLDLQTTEHGYCEVFPPFMANRESMTATGQLPKMQEDMYYCEKDDLYIIPTAEVPITNIHRNEILDAAKMPIKYCGYSACFRREAGSYGRDVRGFLRVHQFNKIELVKFVRPEESYQELELLRLNAEEVLKRLGLHYRILDLCSGDLSFASAKTYDLEVWAPGEGKYLECSSCSNFEDFQARRGGIRYKEKGGKAQPVHTLNGSGLATSRLIVALMETYQNEDGSITIPEALRPWMNGLECITKP
jgi:seryl-tRNA synthetase